MDFFKAKLEALSSAIRRDGIEKVVVGAVIRRRQSVLVLKRQADDFMGGLVELPSGAVDKGEDIIEALNREVREETGLQVIAVKAFLGIFDYRSGSGKQARQLNFLVNVKSYQVCLNPAEHSHYYWLSLTSPDWQALNISQQSRRIIELALANS